MAEQTPEPIPTPREGKPVSQRNDAYSPATPPPQRNSNGNQTLTLILTAAVFLLVGLLLATLLTNDDEVLDEETLRAAVNEAVGTQVGALGLAPGDPDTARASQQDMVVSASPRG